MAEPRTIALIVAAGQGVRAGGAVPKQYARVGGKAVLAHPIDALAGHPAIDGVQVVIGAGQEALYAEAIGERTLPPPVQGGTARRASVAAGLAALSGERVLIHDAARPFVPRIVVDRLLAALDTHAGAVPVLAVADTLAAIGDDLGPTIARDGLVRVQTPQAFRLDAIRAAHARWDPAAEATDDAQMLRAAGGAVAMVEGSRMLEKLTTAEDVAAADAILSARATTRTGLGFDVHGFDAGDAVIIGGVSIPHHHRLAGHSDADVGLHAIVDALLGALGAGDIGDHFPPSDMRWRGADSGRFVEHARDLVAAAGGRIDHVDLTLICERPKIGPHKPAIRARVAALLQVPEGRVSVKATTTERLGFTGREEGIAAQAIATIRLPEPA